LTHAYIFVKDKALRRYQSEIVSKILIYTEL